MIGRIYQKYDYLIDPHTAVAFDAWSSTGARRGTRPLHRGLHRQSLQVLRQRPQRPGPQEESRSGRGAGWTELSEKTGMPAPSRWHPPDKEIRFTQTVEKDHMVDAVLGMLE